MPLQLEDYGLIGDTHTAALVGNDGSIDWLCLPRFDSAACFAALLGGPEHGRWRLAPVGEHRAVDRRYRLDSLVLETDFATADGSFRVVDCMPVRADRPELFRRVEGLAGRVPVRSEVLLRLDYGQVVPWFREVGKRTSALAGPDAITVDSDVEHELEGNDLAAEFFVNAGEHVELRLAWSSPLDRPPERVDVGRGIAATERWWRDWAGRCSYEGEYRDAVVRSLITLKAMSCGPTGGIVAAPTTSLPENLGGERNWDYRYCWIRDATFTLLSLLHAGYESEAVAWREWLLRAVAGQPEHGIPPDESAWRVQRVLMDFLEGHWREPDEGIWEIRGDRRHFTHSKVMAWAAVDRAIKGVEMFDLDGPVENWRRLRREISDDVCEHGYDARRNTFTQYYGSREPDAALLLMAQVGFLPAKDRRFTGTVAAIEENLCRDGFVNRYTMTGASQGLDGLPPGEGTFLPCTFWLADAYLLAGRREDGREVFERLLGLRSDLGLLSEEYDVEDGRLVGNYPQALSHLALVNTACELSTGRGPGHHRAGGDPAR
jgi:GH15 family glucan-1,4-alpha-glucosidase